MIPFLVGSAVVWSLLRLLVWPGHKLTFWGTMEAFAHIWVGFAFAVIYYTEGTDRAWAIGSLAVPSAVETVMAVAFLKGWYVR